jgi:hypothetical protein
VRTKKKHTLISHTQLQSGEGRGVGFSVLPNWSSGRVLDWIISPSSLGWLAKSLTFRMWPPPCVFLKPPGGLAPHIFLYFYLIASLLLPFVFGLIKKSSTGLLYMLPYIPGMSFFHPPVGTSAPDASPWPFLDKNLSCPMIFYSFW